MPRLVRTIKGVGAQGAEVKASLIRWANRDTWLIQSPLCVVPKEWVVA